MSIVSSSPTRSCVFTAVAAAFLAIAVAGCSSKVVPPCPLVRIDNATAGLTKFKAGPGRDVTDIEYQAEIVGYKGQCVHDEGQVELIFDVDLAVIGGPAAKGGSAPLYYFVAIPQFFPSPAGKRVIEAKVSLPARSGARQRVTESNVRVKIPLKKDQAAASFDVYVGFQLDADQLAYNRSRTP